MGFMNGIDMNVEYMNSESKPRCPEQPEAYNFTNIYYNDRRKTINITSMN